MSLLFQNQIVDKIKELTEELRDKNLVEDFTKDQLQEFLERAKKIEDEVPITQGAQHVSSFLAINYIKTTLERIIKMVETQE